MIRIEICPAYGGQGGWYRATGHAGNDRVCTAVTAIEECLAANLEETWEIRVRRTAEKGSYRLSWNKTDKRGVSIRRANSAAGFAYTGLKALGRQYPAELEVIWKRPETDRKELMA